MSLRKKPPAAARPRTRGGGAARRSTRLCVDQPVSRSAMASRRCARRDNLICALPRAHGLRQLRGDPVLVGLRQELVGDGIAPAERPRAPELRGASSRDRRVGGVLTRRGTRTWLKCSFSGGRSLERPVFRRLWWKAQVRTARRRRGPRPRGAWPTGRPRRARRGRCSKEPPPPPATAYERLRIRRDAYRGLPEPGHAPRTATNGQREASPSTLPAARPRAPGMPP